MSNLKINLSQIIINNSIVNNLQDEKLDTLNPFTFIEYLNYAKIIEEDIKSFNNYQDYIRKWSNFTKKTNTNFDSLIKTEFINLFKELKLNYTTYEESRFLKNLNYNDDKDLSIAIPFFAKKIKEIIFLYKNKRDTFSKLLRETKDKGSITNIKNYITSKITDIVNEDSFNVNIISNNPLSSLPAKIQIDIEESYDNFNDYYDLDPNKPPEFYNADFNRDFFYSSNTNTISGNDFIDFEKAIINFINTKDIKLSELNELSPKIEINEVNDDFLDNTDYNDYRKTNRENLKIFQQAELVKNLIGTDYFYLSTDDNKNFTFDNLFEGNNKVSNLLNINNPTTLSIPSTANIYERDTGIFYKPTKFSLLKMKGGFNRILKQDLKANKLYIFPDPSSFGNITGLSNSKNETPYEFIVDDSVFKNRSSSFGIRNPKLDSRDQGFYSYDSFQQKRVGLNHLSTFNSPIPNINNYGIIDSHFCDIYGNMYFSYIKDTSYIKFDTNQTFENDRKIFKSSNTRTSYVKTLSSKLDYFDKKNTEKNIYVLNVSTNKYQPISSTMEKVFKKYNFNSLLFDELNTNIREINVVYDIFSIKTDNFTLIDSYKYDGDFSNTSSNPLILNNNGPGLINSISNDYIVKDIIYKTRINMVPSASAHHDLYYYEFYSYNLNDKKFNTIVSKEKNSFDYFNDNFKIEIPAKVYSIKNSNLNFNSKTGLFSLTVQYLDLNENTYLHSLLYRIINNNLEIYSNKLFTPNNYFNTTTFYTSAGLTAYNTGTISSTPTLLSADGIVVL